FGREFRELLALEQRLRIQNEAPRLLLEQPPAELDAPLALLTLQDVLDLAARTRADGKCQPVAARPVTRLRDDLDDVTVLQAGAKRHHFAVHARADALVADVGVNHV